jgi:hypothetical protein
MFLPATVNDLEVLIRVDFYKDCEFFHTSEVDFLDFKTFDVVLLGN